MVHGRSKAAVSADYWLHRTIEEHLKTTCSDLIKELVIVGTNRPAIALLAETTHPDCADEVKNTIIQRMAAFHQRRMPRERLTLRNIVFVPQGTLPRTVRFIFLTEKISNHSG
jgi:uncharacterized protein (DUF111 family)